MFFFFQSLIGINAQINAKVTAAAVGVLEIEGFGKQGLTSFENCKYGVSTTNTYKNLITKNNMSKVLYGVYASAPRRGQINNNSVTSTEVGICVTGSSNSTFYTSSNTITAASGSGIKYAVSKASKGQYYAETNVIYLESSNLSPIGISAMNVSTAICSNRIFIKGTGSIGINLENTQGSYFKNSIKGQNTKSNIGIQATMTKGANYDNRMYRDSVTNTNIGFRFNGFAPTDFILNISKTHSYGLYLYQSAYGFTLFPNVGSVQNAANVTVTINSIGKTKCTTV